MCTKNFYRSLRNVLIFGFGFCGVEGCTNAAFCISTSAGHWWQTIPASSCPGASFSSPCLRRRRSTQLLRPRACHRQAHSAVEKCAALSSLADCEAETTTSRKLPPRRRPCSCEARMPPQGPPRPRDYPRRRRGRAVPTAAILPSAFVWKAPKTHGDVRPGRC